MVRLFSKIYLKQQRHDGLTLIEVLIALAIVGIAMLAVIKAVSQNIRATHYLQQKTVALWVAQSILNEAKAGVLAVDHSSGNQATTHALGQDWHWQLFSETTPNPHIFKLMIKVFATESDQEADSAILTLEGYQYNQEQANA
jgi:general secretion pathway protein I